MSAPPDSLGFLIADVARLLRRAFQSHLGDDPLTFAQSRALVYLARRQGVRQVDLAELLEVQPITLARLVDQLAEAGLVERRPDPSDRRVHRLHLTPQAAPHLARIRAIAGAVHDEALGGLGPEDAARAIASLQRMRDALSTPRRATRPPGREP
jgi:DNA-binding MarR family transcriptional regulator